MRKWILAVMMMAVMSSGARAAELDPLLQKLVDKGVLTGGEAQEIAVGTKEQVKKDIAAGKSDVLPQWIQNTKFKGDLRVRYQWNKKKASEQQHRGRVRARLGVESKVNDKITVAVGVATGKTADPRSTNQTFTDSSDKKTLILDYAYAAYAPAPWVTIYAGKMKIPFWEAGDLIWDTDITPEGGAVNFNKKLNSKISLFANTGVFVIDESNSAGRNDDPTLYVLEPGVEFSATDKIKLKGALLYQNFSNVKGYSLDNNSSSNTYVSGTNLRYGYVSVSPQLEVSFSELIPKLPYLALFGEYVANPRVTNEKNESGYMYGIKLGAAKVAAFGDWQLRANYARLEKDAIPDILPDSDRYSGKCGIKAHEVMFDYGLGKNTWLGLDVYHAKNIAAKNSVKGEMVWQMDWNLKF